MTTSVTSTAVNLGDFRLESGVTLPEVTVAFETFGTLNDDRTNAILIEHALTGDSHVTSAGVAGERSYGSFAPGWWEGVIGPGRAVDTDDFFVVCANSLGGCGGTTGPTSPAADGLPWGSRFPCISIRDMVNVEIALSDVLGIERWHAVIGGSMGGARALELALLAPHRVARTAILAAPAYSQADQIAWAYTQIQAITMDRDYCGGDYLALGRFPSKGLGLARQIAHLTYRADLELNHRFGHRLQDGEPEDIEAYYSIQSYLDHQAGKLINRFDAQSYIALTVALRDHDVRRGRSSNLREALSGARCDFRVLSMSSDRLFPPHQVAELASALPGRVDYSVVKTWAGHDGFLTEAGAVGAALGEFVLS